MNGNAHRLIFRQAENSLPEELKKNLSATDQLLDLVANYPDLFDDPSKPDAKKDALDPEWRRFCVYPETMKAHALHFWPDNLDEQFKRIPLMEYLLNAILESRIQNDTEAFWKFSGCLSHLFGDTTQAAHLDASDNSTMIFISQLRPPPSDPKFANFHYHTSIEAVTGCCDGIYTPELLGTSIPECAWNLAHRCREAVIFCRRFVIPIIDALFSGNHSQAEHYAGESMKIAVQLTLDAMYTILRIAENKFPAPEASILKTVDLRLLKPDEEWQDSVYGGKALLDGNKNVPPNNVPITPALLRFADGVREVRGLGVLPHSGMCGPRESSMTYYLPRGVFRSFSATVGMHAALAVGGAAEFTVLLDHREVFSSGVLRIDDLARNVMVELGNAECLTLRVRDGNNGSSFWKNHAVWGVPTLNK